MDISNYYDIAALLFLVIMVWAGWRRGLISGLIRLVGRVATLVAALLLCAPGAQQVYSSFLEQPVQSYVEEHIVSSEGAEVLAENMDQLLEAFGSNQQVLEPVAGILALLPGGLLTLAGGEQEAAIQVITDMLDSSATLAEAITQAAIAPALLVILQAVIFLLIFFVGTFVVGLLERLFMGMNSVPVIGAFNGMGGGLLGAVESVVWIYVAGVLCTLLIAAIGDQSFLSASILRETQLVSKILYFRF